MAMGILPSSASLARSVTRWWERMLWTGLGKWVACEVLAAATGQTKPLMNTEFGSPAAKPAGSSDPNQYSEDPAGTKLATLSQRPVSR